MIPLQRILLVMTFAALFLGAPHVFAADDSAQTRELERMKREMREKKKKLKRADKKERSILNELDAIDRGIQTGSAELADQRQRLQEAESTLRDVERSNGEVNRQLALLKRAYAERLRALYKMSRNSYVTAVLAPEAQGGALRRAKYLSFIAERDRAVMRQYGNAMARLESKQTEIVAIKADILQRQRSVEKQKSELEAKRGRKAALLAGVRQEKGLYEQTLRELEESSASLWAMIKRSERERQSAAPLAPRQEQAMPKGRGVLPWPIDGPLLTRFGMQRHPQFGTMVYRRGIEIQATEGEQVRAVQAGEVKFADWYKGHGNLVIIDHGSGFYTLYGNLSRLDATAGSHVQRGQALGRAGDAGSPRGAKLYFEVRRNGEAQDPLAWLSRR